MILLVYLIILSAYFNIAIALVVAFLLGIMKNMWFGETIGTASIVYILIVYGIHLYKRKFNARAVGFLFCASVVIILLNDIIESRSVYFSQLQLIRAITTTFIGMLLFKIIYKIWGPHEDERKLPV